MKESKLEVASGVRTYSMFTSRSFPIRMDTLRPHAADEKNTSLQH
jgi:hypothetical protein